MLMRRSPDTHTWVGRTSARPYSRIRDKSFWQMPSLPTVAPGDQLLFKYFL